MKLTYPICCGVDVHKTFLVATVFTSDGIIPHYHQNMESTGKYWVPVRNVLEGDIHVCLANPKWIGDLFRMGLVPGSYIPVKDIRVLREFTRYRRPGTVPSLAAGSSEEESLKCS